MTWSKPPGKTKNSDATRSWELNLLKPDIYGLLEEGERRASFIRLVFTGMALIVWVMVALRAWEIGIIVIERRPDELEVARLSQEIEDVRVQLNVVPKEVREAREELSTQVNWESRISGIRSLAPEGCAFGPYHVRQDCTVELSGFVREPLVYARILDSMRKAEFVTGINSASLHALEEGHYEFSIVLATCPEKEND